MTKTLSQQNNVITVNGLIEKINIEIESAVPTRQKMITDLKMMNFKIRPLSGDLFSIPANTDISLLTSLWKIGKIEEVVKVAVATLNEDDIESFFYYLEDLQGRLGHIVDYDYDIDNNASRGSLQKKLVKLEIFRDPEYGEIAN